MNKDKKGLRSFRDLGKNTARNTSASNTTKEGKTARGKTTTAKRPADKKIPVEKYCEEQTKMFDDFFTSTVTPLVLLDKDFNFIRVNEAYAKIWQRDTSYFIGKNRFALDPSSVRPIFEEVVRTKKPFKAVEYPFQFAGYPEEEATYWNWSLTPLLDKKGDVEMLILSSENVTKHKMAEKALRLVSSYERSLIEASLDPLVTIDSKGRISDVNMATERVTGYSRNKLIGTDFSNYFTDPEKAKTGYQLVFQEGTVRDYELEICHRDGHITPVLYNASIYRDDTGKVMGVFAAARDITEKVRLEKEYHQTQKMQAMGTLAGGIAHDFNNIIAGIIGFTEMVLDDVSPESAIHRRLELVLKGAYRGRDLVRQILTFSHKSKEEEKKPVSLSVVLNEALPLLRASLPSTIEIRTHILAKNDVIPADQTQIHQVMLNLCANAAHAMSEKGGVLEFTITEENLSSQRSDVFGDIKPGAYVKLTVSDTGCGIKPELLERIFDPFFTTKAPGEGTGLGLSIAHGIIKSHDGLITVKSSPGKGTLFTIYLPKITQDAVSEISKETDIRGGTESVLLVDDEALLVEMSKQRLERLGYKATGASDGAEALRLLDQAPHTFDLVITDYTMPHMTGLELAKKILRIRPDIPVILCSGLNEPVPLEKAKETGIKEFFAKPINKDEFARLIRHVLDKETSKKGK